MTKYTAEHEWIRLEGDLAVVGITEHAQEQLGELVYVELPQVGEKFSQGESTGVVESTKTASEIYAPLDCEIVAINEILESDPGLVNRSPEGEGWFYKIALPDPNQLEQLLDQEEI